MLHPDLIGLRRRLLPALERLEDAGIVPEAKYSFRIHDAEYAGVWRGVGVEEARRRLRDMDSIHPRNLAACKYRESDDGSRVYEYGSYAHTTAGFFGKYQTHFRLLPHEDGTAVFAHYELNPLSRPIKHYRGVDRDVEQGKMWVRHHLGLDTNATLDGLVFE